MPRNVVVLGAGEIGFAIGSVLTKKGAQVEYWDKDDSIVPNQKTLDTIIPQADFVFLCIPSVAVRPAVIGILSLLRPDAIVISLAKSIEEDTKKTMDEVLAEVLPNRQPFAILAGPLLAEELVTGAGGVAVAGSSSQDARETLLDLFSDTKIVLEVTDDIHGAALCGVVKNIYAIGVGAIDGLGWGDNMKGCFVGRSLCEIIFVIEHLGGKHATVCGSAGYGDFIATAFSKFSGHRGFGEQIAKGIDCKRDKEGCKAIPSVAELLGDKTKDLPIFTALYDVIVKNKDVKKTIESAIYG